MDKYEITICKNNKLLRQAGEIIQKSKSNLTESQQKLIDYMISCLIEPQNDEYNLEMLFNLKEYCILVGKDCNDPINYEDIKNDLQKLRDTSLWIPIKGKNGEVIDTLVSWIKKTKICKEKELIYIKLDEDLVPLLFEVLENFISVDSFASSQQTERQG